jgi:hypothetical protein
MSKLSRRQRARIDNRRRLAYEIIAAGLRKQADDGDGRARSIIFRAFSPLGQDKLLKRWKICLDPLQITPMGELSF